MNEYKRKLLRRACALISEAGSIVENVIDKEQIAFDNLPDGIQECKYGCKFEDTIESLEDAVENIGEANRKITIAIT